MQKKNTKNHFLNKHRYLLVGILCLFGICLLSAQNKKKSPSAPEKKKVDSIEQKRTETPEKKKTRVDLLYADEAQADKHLRPDVQVLIGSVRMKHDRCQTSIEYLLRGIYACSGNDFLYSSFAYKSM